MLQLMFDAFSKPEPPLESNFKDHNLFFASYHYLDLIWVLSLSPTLVNPIYILKPPNGNYQTIVFPCLPTEGQPKTITFNFN